MADLKKIPDLLTLRPTVQHYDWGGTSFIPSLLKMANDEKRPFAELWIGAHSKSPATTDIEGKHFALDRLVDSHAPELLGEQAVEKFGSRLPFLFKILDVGKMLSIQVHPTKAQAELGFRRENELGIPLSAPHRNYRDDNHKPEVHVALSEFWMLHGFRPLEEIATLFSEKPGFVKIMPEFAERFRQAGKDKSLRKRLLKDLYARIMTLPQNEVDEILSPVLAQLQILYENGSLVKESPDFWAARAAKQFIPPEGRCDRGIFSIYLLNLVHLNSGEGTFQDAGVLHAYLEGQTVELMANSDNVLRGGLTTKHIDIPELLQTVAFKSHSPKILTGDQRTKNELIFETPVDDFQLSKIAFSKSDALKSSAPHGLEIFIVLEGEIGVHLRDESIAFSKGQIFLLRTNALYRMKAVEKTKLFRASVP